MATRAPFVGPPRRGSFAMQIGAFGDKAKANMDTVARKLVIEMAKSLVLKSPVLTGRFRNNWQSSFGTPIQATTEEVDASGAAAIARATSVALQFPMGQTFWITNALPYALPLEYGHSQQAPRGMVRLTQLEFQTKVAEIAREVAR